MQRAEVVIPPGNIHNLHRDALQHLFHGLSVNPLRSLWAVAPVRSTGKLILNPA